jgi:hypothetical protein
MKTSTAKLCVSKLAARARYGAPSSPWLQLAPRGTVSAHWMTPSSVTWSVQPSSSSRSSAARAAESGQRSRSATPSVAAAAAAAAAFFFASSSSSSFSSSAAAAAAAAAAESARSCVSCIASSRSFSPTVLSTPSPRRTSPSASVEQFDIVNKTYTRLILTKSLSRQPLHPWLGPT